MRKTAARSVAPYSLKRKLNVSFALMSVLPLLVSAYLLSTYVLPKFGLKFDVIISMGISIFIAIAGFFVIKEVVDRVVSVSSEAKLIAAGDINRQLKLEHEDEVGDLSEALNQLTNRIRGNMDELKSYSEKTSEINVEIQRRVLMLSSLLQISSLISQGAKLEDIFKLIAEKSRLLADADLAFLLFREEGIEAFSMKVADGPHSEKLLKIMIGPQEALLNASIVNNKPFIFDRVNMPAKERVAEFQDKFKLKAAMAMPVFLRGRVIAFLGIGSDNHDLTYKKEDLELLDIFAKQVAISVENDILMHRVEKLEIKDVLTGLYNEAFIRTRLQEEIKRAIVYQRPCAFVIMNVDNFRKYHEAVGSIHSESTLKKIAHLIRDSVTEIDRVGRTGDNEFAIVLPEKNKRQARDLAESIREKIESVYKDGKDPAGKLTVSGGVSENPLDGVDAAELITKAKELLSTAKAQGKNRIVSVKEKI